MPSSEEMEDFAKKVLMLLAARDEPQAKLARSIGVDTSQFSRWMSGKGKPQLPELIAIARYFHVPIDYLVDDTIVDLPEEIRLTKEDWIFLENYWRARDAGHGESVMRFIFAHSPATSFLPPKPVQDDPPGDPKKKPKRNPGVA